MENIQSPSDAPSTPANAAMPLPGAALAAARKARGATVEDVARLLKLSVAQVTAIEADDHSQLPAPIFVRGFIRSYAKLLNVDIAPLLPAKAPAPVITDEHMMHRTPGVAIEPRRYGRMPAMLAGVAVVLAALAIYEFSLNPPLSPQGERTVSAEAAAPAVSGMDAARAGPSNASASTTVAAATPERPAAAPVLSDNLQLKKSTDPTSGAGEKGLHFLFNGESWVEVRGRDGKVVFSMVNQPGSERIVRGDPPFSLVIGGASGVQLSYNGSRVDLASYVNEDVARLRLE